jgi:CheY-like chemotaxis protein
VKRILLMDDSAIFLEVMRAALEKEGYAVVCASTLAELDGVRASGDPSDLVLMDVQMPEAFGDDIAMTLRHAYGVQAPIYLLSSLEETELAERAKWAEIDGFISKNRGLDAVITAVRGILEQRGA